MTTTERFYNTTEKMAKAVRAYREGLLLIDEVEEVFKAEVDKIISESTIDFVHTETYYNATRRAIFEALVELTKEAI